MSLINALKKIAEIAAQKPHLLKNANDFAKVYITNFLRNAVKRADGPVSHLIREAKQIYIDILEAERLGQFEPLSGISGYYFSRIYHQFNDANLDIDLFHQIDVTLEEKLIAPAAYEIVINETDFVQAEYLEGNAAFKKGASLTSPDFGLMREGYQKLVRAAKLGNVGALYAISHIHFSGEPRLGIRRNTSKSFAYLNQASEKRSISANFYLANIFQRKKNADIFGIKPDLTKAAIHFRLATESILKITNLGHDIKEVLEKSESLSADSPSRLKIMARDHKNNIHVIYHAAMSDLLKTDLKGSFEKLVPDQLLHPDIALLESFLQDDWEMIKTLLNPDLGYKLYAQIIEYLRYKFDHIAKIISLPLSMLVTLDYLSHPSYQEGLRQRAFVPLTNMYLPLHIPPKLEEKEVESKILDPLDAALHAVRSCLNPMADKAQKAKIEKPELAEVKGANLVLKFPVCIIDIDKGMFVNKDVDKTGINSNLLESLKYFSSEWKIDAFSHMRPYYTKKSLQMRKESVDKTLATPYTVGEYIASRFSHPMNIMMFADYPETHSAKNYDQLLHPLLEVVEKIKLDEASEKLLNETRTQYQIKMDQALRLATDAWVNKEYKNQFKNTTNDEDINIIEEIISDLIFEAIFYPSDFLGRMKNLYPNADTNDTSIYYYGAVGLELEKEGMALSEEAYRSLVKIFLEMISDLNSPESLKYYVMENYFQTKQEDVLSIIAFQKEPGDLVDSHEGNENNFIAVYGMESLEKEFYRARVGIHLMSTLFNELKSLKKSICCASEIRFSSWESVLDDIKLPLQYYPYTSDPDESLSMTLRFEMEDCQDLKKRFPLVKVYNAACHLAIQDDITSKHYIKLSQVFSLTAQLFDAPTPANRRQYDATLNQWASDALLPCVGLLMDFKHRVLKAISNVEMEPYLRYSFMSTGITGSPLDPVLATKLRYK